MGNAVGLNQKMQQVRALADAKGFSSDSARIWEMLALIHTEISEATDAYKKGEPCLPATGFIALKQSF
jgi:hypothetical protein